MRSINLIAFSAIISLAAAASAAPSFESLLDTNARSESLTAAETPAPLPEERCVYPGDDAPIEDILIWIECMAYPETPSTCGDKSAGSTVEKSVAMSRLNANALKTISQARFNTAPQTSARGVHEISAAIDQAVTRMELALKARDRIALREEAAGIEPLAAHLADISAGIEGSQAGKDIKKISENLNTYLQDIRTKAELI